MTAPCPTPVFSIVSQYFTLFEGCINNKRTRQPLHGHVAVGVIRPRQESTEGSLTEERESREVPKQTRRLHGDALIVVRCFRTRGAQFEFDFCARLVATLEINARNLLTRRLCQLMGNATWK